MKTKILSYLVLFLVLISLVSAWNDCPSGITDCNSPCGLFTDSNSDGECDHSQENPSLQDNSALSSIGSSSETLDSESIINEDDNIIKDINQNSKNTYPFIPITMVLLVLYFISVYLVKLKKLTLLKHRQIWNILLLITFLVSGILGIMLVLRVNYGFFMVFPVNILRIHVNYGIAMAIICIFHIFWHLPYYKMIFKKRK